MTWIILTVFLLLTAAASLKFSKVAASKATTKSFSDDPWSATSTCSKAAGWLAVGGVVLLTVLSSVYIMNPGHVGVIKTFGNLSGVAAQDGRGGTAIVAPWADVSDVSVQIKKADFTKIQAFSKETQDVFVDARLSLSVDPKAVRILYTRVGPNWFDVLIPGLVDQTVKEETVKFSTTEEAPNRALMSVDIGASLQTALYSQFCPQASNGCFSPITVTAFQLRNISFDPAFTTAIRDKQIAAQRALQARNNVATAKYQADQVIASAQGAAGATLVNARAQSKANDLLAASLTPELIQFTLIKTLGPTIKTIIAPGITTGILPGLGK